MARMRTGSVALDLPKFWIFQEAILMVAGACDAVAGAVSPSVDDSAQDMTKRMERTIPKRPRITVKIRMFIPSLNLGAVAFGHKQSFVTTFKPCGGEAVRLGRLVIFLNIQSQNQFHL